MTINKQNGKIGILVGGGPAPGINGVIAAATIEAIEHRASACSASMTVSRWWLARNDVGHVKELAVDNVLRIHFDGGSILRTARENPTKKRTRRRWLMWLSALPETARELVPGDHRRRRHGFQAPARWPRKRYLTRRDPACFSACAEDD